MADTTLNGPLGQIQSQGPDRENADIIISYPQPAGMWEIASFENSWTESSAIDKQLGMKTPESPASVNTASDATLLWIAPVRCLLVSESDSVKSPELSNTAVSDLSHARFRVRVAGPQARELLSKGYRIDLHQEVFQAGMCAVSPVHHYASILHCRDAAPEFDVYVIRSHARDFVSWLIRSSEEFSTRIEVG